MTRLDSLTDPRAVLAYVLFTFGCLWIIRKQDPAALIAELLYVMRRAIWIAGQMIADTPGEYATRWREQRPRDKAAIESLEEKYPAGETE